MITTFNRSSGMKKLESKCTLCVRESCNERDGCAVVVVERDRFAVVLVKYGVVVGLLPKAEVAELHVLSNGLILELISSLKIHLKTFLGSSIPKIFLTTKNFWTMVEKI